MPPLSWRHHTLIQALLSRGPLKEDEFRYIFSQVTGKPSGSQQAQQQLFNEFLRKINAELNYVQLELRACRNQYDGSVHYGVVNNVSDDQSKLGTKYTVPQIAFYKGIVEAIIQDPEAGGFIYSTAALNIRLENQVTDSQQSQGQVPSAFKNFSMTQKEKTLGQLVKDQWLCLIPDGKIGIGVRSFLDLRSWFRTNEVPACDVCNEASVKAQVCENEACNVRLHHYCVKKKFSRKRAERVCPGCGAKWPGSTVKAEAVEEANGEHSAKRRRNSDMAASDSAVKAEAVEKANAAEPSAERRRNADMSASSSDTKRVTRRSARLTAS